MQPIARPRNCKRVAGRAYLAPVHGALKLGNVNAADSLTRCAHSSSGKWRTRKRQRQEYGDTSRSVWALVARTCRYACDALAVH